MSNPYAVIITVDPGVNGGIAVWERECSPAAVNMPATPEGILHILDKANSPYTQTLIVIEEVPLALAPSVKVSVASMAKLQRNFGIVYGCAISTSATVKTVTPQAWQKAVCAGHKKTYGDRWKAHLKELAQEAFPTLKPTLKTADALLIMKKVLTEVGEFGTL